MTERLAGRARRIRAGRLRSGEPLSPVITDPFEGDLAQYGVVHRVGRTGSVGWTVFVWFGRRHPTASQLARASAELRTAAP